MTHHFLRVVTSCDANSTNYQAALADADYSKLLLASSERNVSVRFRLNGRPATVSMRPDVRDLFDLTACVYIADELAPRTDDISGWRRELDVLFPVMTPGRWRGIEDELSTTLGFLSGDQWSLEWAQLRRMPTYDRHRRRVAGCYDAVCLFSGGVDSLVGAATLLSEGRRVLLVGHQAEGSTSDAQNRMISGLRRRFGAGVTFVDCYVARARGSSRRWALRKVDNTHRSRSFLFLGIASAVAMASGCREIVMPENGVIALNSPIALSRLGASSTRTAHPRFLKSFTSILNTITGEEFSLRNPLMYKSKTDTLRDAPQWLRDMAVGSVSCSHPDRIRYTGTRGIRHCGYCIPCIYRRAAFMAIGQDEPAHYLRDVFQDLSGLTSTEAADLRLLHRWAKRVVASSYAAVQSMVFAHGVFDPEWCRTPQQPNPLAGLTEMLKAWAEEFCDTVEEVASDSTKRILGV